MKIEITASDITCGITRSARFCPIARAFKRITGDQWSICLGSAQKWKDGRTIEVRLPVEANQFILDFDGKKPVSPFSFEVKLP